MGSSNLHWQIGDVRITRIVENEVSLPAVAILPEATPEALAPHESWLKPHFVDGDGNIVLSIHALVIEAAGLTILVDTCVGDQSAPGFEVLSKPNSSFLEDLAASGFARERVDLVLCTHLHFDHVGWNTLRQGDDWVPTFPNARYLFAREEWNHWKDEANPVYTATLDSAVQPIFDAGLAELVETNHRICDSVWLEATPGHTPGHVAVRITSGGQRALITGDLTHHPVQWAETHWRMSADSDSRQAGETRRRLLAEHGDQPTLVIGTHYAAPCAGHLKSDANGWRFEALKPES
jgi:glyoxylase-like metal-dependent hydrolase (beta-lactamase superfamily II)